MNFRRLEYFLNIAQTGNLRRSSELLNVSAPALSKAMALLEQELELKLWVREGRNIILTDSGKKLLRRAPTLIEEFRSLKEQLQQEHDTKSPVRIGTFEVFSTYFLSFIEKIKWTEVPLTLHELIPGEIEKFVASGDLDFGISYMPVPHPDLDFLKITSIEMGVYIRQGSFAGIPQQDLPFVVPVAPLSGTPSKIRGLDGWPETAYQRKILHQVTLMESALELCRQGLVAGYFPVFIAHEHNKRVVPELRLERRRPIAQKKLCYCDVFLVKRKSTVESTDLKQIAKAIRLVCG